LPRPYAWTTHSDRLIVDFSLLVVASAGAALPHALAAAEDQVRGIPAPAPSGRRGDKRARFA
jgi:hypothetical protein